MDEQGYDPLLLLFAKGVLDRLDKGQHETLQERAAIIEFEAGCQPRALAEALALVELLCRTPTLVSNFHVLEVEIGGATEWLLGVTPQWTTAYAEALSGRVLATRDLAEVLHQQYEGVAQLCRVG